MVSNIILRSMAKIAIKYENIVPHSGIFLHFDFESASTFDFESTESTENTPLCAFG